jgi:indole-3-glycerol phosphate synthase
MSTPSVPPALSRIADECRRRVEAMKLQVPGYELRARLRRQEPAGRLERALRRGRPADPLRLLCEIGPPAARDPRLPAMDAVAVARLFEQHGASALSLAPEPGQSPGDPAWVGAVRPAVRLPILVSEVVVDSYQLLTAAVHGADGVLLVTALLSGVQLQRLIGEARLLGLDPLVAARDAEEMATAVRAGATVLALHHRLISAGADPEASLALIGRVPPLVTAVFAGDFADPGVLARLRGTRCDAVLVGEALLGSADPVESLARFVAAARA